MDPELVAPHATALLDEIEAAVKGLSDADLIRLERFARFHVYRYPAINAKEVLAEAVTRILDGRRSWPRHVRFRVFVCSVIRSIADEFRDDAKATLDGQSEDDLDVLEQRDA